MPSRDQQETILFCLSNRKLATCEMCNRAKRYPPFDGMMKNLCSFANRQGSPIFLVANAQGFYNLRRVEREIIALAINQKRDDKSRGSR